MMQPFVDITDTWTESKKLLKKFKFKITDVKATEYQNGWIGVCVEWNSTHHCRMVRLGLTSFAYSKTSFTLVFTDPEAEHTVVYDDGGTGSSVLGIEVGLFMSDDNRLPIDEKITHEPKFFENLKYGVLVYFAPKDFFDTEGKTIFELKK